jgi:hypothetical protein
MVAVYVVIISKPASRAENQSLVVEVLSPPKSHQCVSEIPPLPHFVQRAWHALAF